MSTKQAKVEFVVLDSESVDFLVTYIILYAISNVNLSELIHHLWVASWAIFVLKSRR